MEACGIQEGDLIWSGASGVFLQLFLFTPQNHQNDWPGAFLGAVFNEWLGDSESGREVGIPLVIFRSPGIECSGLQ